MKAARRRQQEEQHAREVDESQRAHLLFMAYQARYDVWMRRLREVLATERGRKQLLKDSLDRDVAGFNDDVDGPEDTAEQLEEKIAMVQATNDRMRAELPQVQQAPANVKGRPRGSITRRQWGPLPQPAPLRPPRVVRRAPRNPLPPEPPAPDPEQGERADDAEDRADEEAADAGNRADEEGRDAGALAVEEVGDAPEPAEPRAPEPWSPIVDPWELLPAEEWEVLPARDDDAEEMAIDEDPRREPPPPQPIPVSPQHFTPPDSPTVPRHFQRQCLHCLEWAHVLDMFTTGHYVYCSPVCYRNNVRSDGY